eukprot:gene4820-4977_t
MRGATSNMVAMQLAALLQADAGGGGTRVPLWSWDRVPLFMHAAKPEGPFDSGELALIRDRFLLVTLEKDQGADTHKPVEQGQQLAGRGIHDWAPGLPVLMYMSSDFVPAGYSALPWVKDHPQWEVTGAGGLPVPGQWDFAFTQEDGPSHGPLPSRTFELPPCEPSPPPRNVTLRPPWPTQPGPCPPQVQDFFVSEVNASYATGHIDGAAFPFLPPPQLGSVRLSPAALALQLLARNPCSHATGRHASYTTIYYCSVRYIQQMATCHRRASSAGVF